jgi:hypothetical protein
VQRCNLVCAALQVAAAFGELVRVLAS